MSIPQSDQQLLLSLAIDDQLSPEEQEMLDRWLREDPSGRRRLEELAATSQQVRQALAPLRQQRLPADFADRVVQAAVQQAEAEAGGAEHPLVRPARSANDRGLVRVGGRRQAMVAAMLALAASVLLVVWLSPGGDRRQRLAGNDPVEMPPAEPGAHEPGAPQWRVPAGGAEGQGLTDQRGRSGGEVPDVSPTDGVAEADDPAASDAAAGQRIAAMPEAATPPSSPRADAATGSESGGGASGAAAPSMRTPLAAVLVVAIDLTDQGRDSLALHQALRAADIRIEPAGVVSERAIGQLQRSSVIRAADDGPAGQLFYIEAPASQIDRLLTQMLADRQAFGSFGFGVATEPALLSEVGAWAEVEAGAGGAFARDLVAADGDPLSIDAGPALASVEHQTGLEAVLGISSVSDDFSSQLLLLVR